MRELLIEKILLLAIELGVDLANPNRLPLAGQSDSSLWSLYEDLARSKNAAQFFEIRRWKDDAISLLMEWDKVFREVDDGNAHTGESTAGFTLQKVKQIKEECARLRAQVEKPVPHGPLTVEEIK